MKLFQTNAIPRYLAFECPGCGGLHQVPVEGPSAWKWNGSMEQPTFHPSIKCTAPPTKYCCHSWVKDGKIQFLPDCSHDLAGKTVELPEVTP